jgi:hypothetical protein
VAGEQAQAVGERVSRVSGHDRRRRLRRERIFERRPPLTEEEQAELFAQIAGPEWCSCERPLIPDGLVAEGEYPVEFVCGRCGKREIA